MLMRYQSGATALYWSQSKWEGMIMLRSSKVKSNTNKTNAQRPNCEQCIPKADEHMIFDTHKC